MSAATNKIKALQLKVLAHVGEIDAELSCALEMHQALSRRIAQLRDDRLRQQRELITLAAMEREARQ